MDLIQTVQGSLMEGSLPKRWDLANANAYVDLLHRKVPLMLPKKFPGKFPRIYVPKLPARFGS